MLQNIVLHCKSRFILFIHLFHILVHIYFPVYNQILYEKYCLHQLDTGLHHVIDPYIYACVCVCLCMFYRSSSRLTHCPSVLTSSSPAVAVHLQCDRLEKTSQTLTFLFIHCVGQIFPHDNNFMFCMMDMDHVHNYKWCNISFAFQQIHYILLNDECLLEWSETVQHFGDNLSCWVINGMTW